MEIKPTRNNIIVINPIKQISSTIEVTEETRREHAEDQLANAEKAEIVAVGKDCVEVKTGDIVRIRTGRFLQAEPLEKGKYLIFSEGDVIAVY